MLLKRLAVGGMAELFLAKDTERNHLVVLKRILPYLAQEVEFVRMFLDEARIASQLAHPNIVKLFELGQLEGAIFISMEFVEGVDLRKIVAKELKASGAIPPPIAAYLVSQLCAGLHYAHTRTDAAGKPLGIIHRDVSPQNLMVGFDGQVKLVDFGIAKANAFMERSKPGVIKGKFLYLSPEQLAQEGIDHRADLFAVGSLLYEISVGKNPFQRPTSEAVIVAVRQDDPEPPVRAREKYPAALSRIVMKCLMKDPARRYQSANEIRADLDAFLAAEAPITRGDLVKYVATHFGDEGERTVLHVPERKNPDEAPATVRARSLGDGADDRTRPLPAQQKPVGGTNPFNEDGRTMAANPEDLMKVQADPTALMPSAAAAAGAPPVKVLTSLPKGGRPRSDVMETDPVASSRGSSRRREPNTMPARPKSLDAIPRGGHGDDEDELSGDSTDAREMTGQSQHTDTRPLERTAIPRTALAVGGAVAFLLVVRIVMWMASSPTPAAPTNSERPVVAAPSTERPKPEPGQPEAATPPAPVAEENEVALVEFVVHGPAGAVVEIDNQPIKVGEKRRLPPGKVHILYGCPVAKRPAVPQKLINADVELRDRPVVYDLKCPPIVVARPPPPKPPVKAPVKTKGTKPAQGGTKRP